MGYASFTCTTPHINHITLVTISLTLDARRGAFSEGHHFL